MAIDLPVTELPPAAAAEDPQAARLLYQSAHLFITELGLAANPSRARVNKQMESMQGRTTVVALDGDRVVGTAGLEIDYYDPQLASLEDVAVVWDYQGLGLGKKLIRLLERKAQEVEVAMLTVMPRSSAAGFYNQLGYQMLRREDLSAVKAL